MWIWTSSVLLATLAVSGLSFPHPDESQYKIPSVGTGQRSQYYVLHSDGTFKYGFDGGDGTFESVKSPTFGNRVGKFGYVDPDGKTIRLEYVAGEGGFVARGDHLPKPSAELAQALAAVVRSATPYIDPLASSDSDASYGFGFQSEDHSRNEQSDADGTVTGSYSYVDENGVTRSFTYRAGKGIGFVIEGDGLTQDIRSPVTRKTTLKRTQQQQQRHSIVKPTTRVAQATARKSEVGLRSSVGQVRGQQASVVSTRSQTPGDSSYSFSYDAGDHSRSEKSDSNLNVDGTFSFVADDGKQRTVSYVAGTQTGFQAEGAHLPKDSDATFGARTTSIVRKVAHSKPLTPSLKSTHQSQLSSATSRGRDESIRTHTSEVKRSEGVRSHAVTTSVQQGKPAILRSSVVGQKFVPALRSFEEANIRSSFTPQGPYSFSYKTSDHSRSESGDASNNVVGNFAYRSHDDNQNREINYEAGSATGFIVEGAHIPVGPIVPGAPSGQPTGRLVRVSTVPFVDPLADSDTDASYSFGFDSDTYSRSEKADEDGNIVGTYTIVDEDGTRITYRFRAGKGIGFETDEISRTQGPRPVKPTPYSGPLAGDLSQSGHFRAHTTHVQTPAVRKVTTYSAQSGQSGATRKTEHKFLGARRFPSAPSVPQSVKSQVKTKSSFTPASILKSSFSPSHSEAVFPGYTLHSYAHTPTSEKFGYVLKFE